VIADLNHVTLRSGRAVRRSPPVKTFRLFARPEPAPNPHSRVTITAARDSLGMNRVRLHWELSPIDERSMRRSQEILGREVGRAGLGRVRSALEDEKGLWTRPEVAYHHIGTTRMHEDPKQGVVDAKGRVHGISNLYIAGSSVFPTAGYANPTLTIVALAVRLADHVKRLLR
jgi:choline dehydrogenase-like flavoprotein